MSFFEQPPPPPDPPRERNRRPEWAGPPPNVIGMPVGERAVLVRRDDLAIVVSGFVAYETGVGFEVIFRGAAEDLDDLLAFGTTMRHPRRVLGRAARATEDDAESAFRFGVEFADGRRATNLSRWWLHRDPDQEPDGPILQESGGGGGGGEWTNRYWLWPLPPQGPLAFVCQWRALRVDETRTVIDATALRAAAQSAMKLWENDPPPGGWTSYGGSGVRFFPDQEQSENRPPRSDEPDA